MKSGFNPIYILTQIEGLGVKLGTHPAKIWAFYLIAALIAAGIYIAIEYHDENERKKLLPLLKILAIIHKICPLCIFFNRHASAKFSRIARLRNRICLFCIIDKAVKRYETHRPG